PHGPPPSGQLQAPHVRLPPVASRCLVWLYLVWLCLVWLCLSRAQRGLARATCRAGRWFLRAGPAWRRSCPHVQAAAGDVAPAAEGAGVPQQPEVAAEVRAQRRGPGDPRAGISAVADQPAVPGPAEGLLPRA